MLNSHGGQPQVMDIVARDLRVRLGMFAVAADLSGLHDERGLFTGQEARHGIHAGAAETSEALVGFRGGGEHIARRGLRCRGCA